MSSLGYRLAATFGGVALLATPLPALALDNPIASTIRPLGAHGAHGHATFYQTGNTVDATVILDQDRQGKQAIAIYRGSCASHAARPDWSIIGVAGTTQETKLPNVRLSQMLGHVLIVHAAGPTSPAIGCAPITG